MRTPKLPAIGLALLLSAGLALAACGDDSSTATKGPSPSADATTTTVATAASVRVEGGALGDHLVDAQGFTLYLFEKDQGTTTACTAACTTNWPAATVNGTPTAGSGVDQSKLATASTGQLTYEGHLLYRFAGDKAAGDTNGTKVASWYAVAPTGKAIELDEVSTTQANMGGGGY